MSGLAVCMYNHGYRNKRFSLYSATTQRGSPQIFTLCVASASNTILVSVDICDINEHHVLQ